MGCSVESVSIPIVDITKIVSLSLSLSLLENMMKVLSKDILSEAIIGNSSAAESTTFTGNKSSRSYSYELPSSKSLRLMLRFNDSDTTRSDSQSASPPAVVS